MLYRFSSLLIIGALLTGAGAEEQPKFTGAEKNYWAFVRPKRHPVPHVKLKSWIRNPVDGFVLAKLEAAGLKPSPSADRVTLIRRATFDLTGLPPTPEEVNAFVQDKSSNAYEKLIDRLLTSPRYGERWARHWLDLARYAESEGFKSDETRPHAWRYRDYVIQAFNEDKPYDRFIKEQLAGDEISPHDPWAAVATAFNRHYPDESNARNLFLRRQDILNDITDTTGAVFLGLTMGCARCHDHKFDPILQKDYYRLQAFFAAVHARDDIAMASEKEMAGYRERKRVWEEKTRDVRAEIAAIEKKYHQEMFLQIKSIFPREIQEAVDTPSDKRTPLQKLIADKAAPQLEVNSKAMAARMKGDVKQHYEDMLKKLDEMVPRPAEPPVGVGITDIGTEAPRQYVLTRGVWDAHAEEVQPGFLSVLDPSPAKLPPPNSVSMTTGRRTALAEWIASADNPLTARVMVNRIWQHHFGRGIVESPSDFGYQGEKPTHPELLDWLATEFVRQGWSIKAMHRLIMNSNTYKQSSNECRVSTVPGRFSSLVTRHSSLSVDPDNKLLWRAPQLRLEAESVRDAMLAVSGELNLTMYGASVFPELPPGVSTRAGWPVTQDPAERNRRSVYIFVRRNMRYPLLEVFDSPDTNETCPRRSTTTTAPQALTLINSELVLRYAQGFAGRVLREAGSIPEKQVERAYHLAFGRPPEPSESSAALEFLKKQTELAFKESQNAKELALPKRMPPNYGPAQGAALVDFCHALFNANEFVYVN